MCCSAVFWSLAQGRVIASHIVRTAPRAGDANGMLNEDP